MIIRIKNMVCRHCVDKVSRIAENIPDLHATGVELGTIFTYGEPSAEAMAELGRQLDNNGFEIIMSREAEMVEGIKRILIELARSDSPESRQPVSDLLADKLNTSYKTLSRIFTESEGRTIENYFMSLRIERVKELLHYGRMALDEIAFMTGFSSAAHLSRRFKQYTGMTPGQFRESGKRKPITEV